MSTSLLKSVSVTRSFISRPTVWNAARSVSQNSKAVTQADVVNVVNVDTVSGAPDALTERSVRIFAPAKPATQSGKNGTRLWRIDFDILEDGNRWENPLIGWASSSDYQQALQIKFTSKEAAIQFAEKQGWNYYVQEPKPVQFVKKAYADNYKYSPGKLRMIKTK
ncbi:ETC complex I subunit conserved region-domain-containing protein [Halteromyces radiatus]|uniref:ETC complex I subunit conserved region-domain-containing protein n=1 Tax=Halteromyces radiatus TaxID=101107 RepID=UPI002220D03D|nr:ETC complex I subunit conserved region-domain-containing protein [Halteromyces radiatus]KAI8096945.1 ETC complex I subunit conserved region-domain-containing protein [Halteromyces radiatus]